MCIYGDTHIHVDMYECTHTCLIYENTCTKEKDCKGIQNMTMSERWYYRWFLRYIFFSSAYKEHGL